MKRLPNKILFETFQEDNWDLFVANADGSEPVNLTHTPDVDELYPHASNDGTKSVSWPTKAVAATKSATCIS